MSSEFNYRWAKDLVLWEMEQDGVIHRARRIAMGAACDSAANRALAAKVGQAGTGAGGFAAAASVFRSLAVAPDPASAAAGSPREWIEAARRARAKARPGSGRARVA